MRIANNPPFLNSTLTDGYPDLQGYSLFSNEYVISRFSWEMLTTLLNSITMKPRALGVSSTLAFVEHERG